MSTPEIPVIMPTVSQTDGILALKIIPQIVWKIVFVVSIAVAGAAFPQLSAYAKHMTER